MPNPSSVSDPSSVPSPGSNRLRVAVLGATGLVGREMTRLLEKRAFPVASFLPLASANPSAREVGFAGESIPVRPVTRELIESCDLVLASAGGAVSREWLPLASAAGAICIDNTSAFRMDPGVPLVVPEVNSDQLASVDLRGGGAIIANPNCSTIQLVVALEPLRRAFGLERVLVSTYQSISGAGRRAVDRFRAASRARLATDDRAATEAATPAFDVLPLIGEPDAGGDTPEEWKMMRETPKILGEEVALDVTCVRVPVFTGHAEAVVVQTTKPVTAAEARGVLRDAPGVRVHDDPAPPTPAAAVGTHEVHVGRLRSSRTFDRGLQFWVVADNLLKGAAWNAVQIAEALVSKTGADSSRAAKPHETLLSQSSSTLTGIHTK